MQYNSPDGTLHITDNVNLAGATMSAAQVLGNLSVGGLINGTYKNVYVAVFTVGLPQNTGSISINLITGTVSMGSLKFLNDIPFPANINYVALAGLSSSGGGNPNNNHTYFNPGATFGNTNSPAVFTWDNNDSAAAGVIFVATN